ncbi:hypothetical protein [Methylobacter sp.]|uniref:hypothetical protein n=1 Tax=Methylobacter sp. TaxID=2051955 RepID=UPI002FDE6176
MINFHQLAVLLKQLGVAVLYALLGLTVLACWSDNGLVSIMWLPAGLALSALLMGGNGTPSQYSSVLSLLMS